MKLTDQNRKLLSYRTLFSRSLRAFIVLIILVAGCVQAFASDQKFCADPVTSPPVTPSVNEGPLQNPLKGFHTGFDESCCFEFEGQTLLNEIYFGNFMATVGYQNFNWADLEPVDDQWNWDKVDNDLSNRAGSKQKHVIVQLNAEWTRGDRAGRTPTWFLEDSRFEENLSLDESGNVEYRSHKYQSTFYQEEVKEFIAEFIHRFKDDERIFIIQMGMVGYFGEFNVFPNDDEWLPEDIKTMFFEHYRNHMFGKVERINGVLVVVENGSNGVDSESYNGLSALTQVRYPAELGYNTPTDGIGYTNGWINVNVPGIGSNNSDIGNKDFNDPIDEIETSDGRKLWRYGPVGGEWPPNREPGVEGVIGEWTSFWSSQVGEDFIKRGHYSFARPPQADKIGRLVNTHEEWSLVPDDWNFFADDAQAVGDNHQSLGGGRFRRWHRMMGYNYQLSNIQHYFTDEKSHINISVDVTNVGLAAFYFDWALEFSILDSANNVVQRIPIDKADMRQWLPGETTTVMASAATLIDTDGEYRIGLRMFQPGADEAKDEAWKLDARNTYVVVSNNIDVVPGVWEDNAMNKLKGGWNVLDDLDFNHTGGSCNQKMDLCIPIKSSNDNVAVVCL